MKPLLFNREAIINAAMNATEREKNLWKEAHKLPDAIPRGWRTRREWAKLWGKKETFSIGKLRALVAMKVMEKRDFKIITQAKQLRAQPHYRLADKP